MSVTIQSAPNAPPAKKAMRNPVRIGFESSVRVGSVTTRKANIVVAKKKIVHAMSFIMANESDEEEL